MNIGYIRVSTEEQRTARQEVIKQALGVDNLFMEKVSGKSQTGRAELEAMLKCVREGDTVIVESISRLARNTRDLLEIVDKLNAKGVGLVSKKEMMDSTTPAGKFMLTMFGAMAQLERSYLLDRQREGIEIAKKEGKYKGRKPISIDLGYFEEIYHKWKNNEFTAVRAMKMLELERATFYRRVKEYEQVDYRYFTQEKKARK